MDLESIRREYLLDGLRRDNLSDSPFIQFERWMSQAIDSGLPDPTAMTLATIDAQSCPSQRIVLLKHCDAEGFVFFTNYDSEKARDMASNANVSLHFPWHMMERQVAVRGIAKKIAVKESLSYFLSRPRESQLAAWASRQSERINSRKFLIAQYESMKAKYKEGDVPLPDFWGGYRVIPGYFEFWQGGESRLHDRFSYQKTDEGTWDISRLAP